MALIVRPDGEASGVGALAQADAWGTVAEIGVVGIGPDGDASGTVALKALAEIGMVVGVVRERKPVVKDGEVSPWESWRGERCSVMGVSWFMSSQVA